MFSLSTLRKQGSRAKKWIPACAGMTNTVSVVLPFYFCLFTCGFLPEAKKSSASTIGATCAFDAKIYKIVDGFFDVTSCGIRNKKKFQNSDFSFQLPSLLVENSTQIANRSNGGASPPTVDVAGFPRPQMVNRTRGRGCLDILRDWCTHPRRGRRFCLLDRGRRACLLSPTHPACRPGRCLLGPGRS